jgi:hypothetical protein
MMHHSMVIVVIVFGLNLGQFSQYLQIFMVECISFPDSA